MIEKELGIDRLRAIAPLAMALLLCLGAGCSSVIRRDAGGHPGTAVELAPESPEGVGSTEGPGKISRGLDPNWEVYEETGSLEEGDEDVSFLADLKNQEMREKIFGQMPEESNARVDYFMRYFQGPKRDWFARALARSGRYLPQMRQIFTEEGLPEDLVYLAMIESGYNPHAHSHAYAMGIWQFIAATGRRYGLVIDGWVDERRDLEKSTRAAARYLRDLYAMFDDWCIATASYNAGEGKLGRAIGMYRSKCFWHISKQKYLKNETKNYVPMFLAAMTIAKDPETYGFGHVVLEPPLLYETVKLPHAMDLAKIAAGCGTDLAHLKNLNPQLRYGCTPPYYRGDYEVKIPQGTRQQFLAYYEQLGPEKSLAFRHHRVRKGETILQVARRHGVTVQALREVNQLGNRSRLRAGENLTIPTPGHGLAGAGSVYASRAAAGQTPAGRGSSATSGSAQRKLIYVVKRGDTLSGVGKRYGVSVNSLMQWNKIRKPSHLHAGQNLVVFDTPAPQTQVTKTSTPRQGTPAAPAGGARSAVHVVRKGDTLSGISRRYGVRLQTLMTSNQLRQSSKLLVGQKLAIPGSRIPAAESELAKSPSPVQGRAATASSAQSSKTIHVVRKGDTLFDLSCRYGVKLPSLLAWNGLQKSSTLRVGQEIRLQPAGTSTVCRVQEAAALETGTATPLEIWYTVRAGDTLFKIAQKHRVTVAQISNWNKLNMRHTIHPGMRLKIRVATHLEACKDKPFTGSVAD